MIYWTNISVRKLYEKMREGGGKVVERPVEEGRPEEFSAIVVEIKAKMSEGPRQMI